MKPGPTWIALFIAVVVSVSLLLLPRDTEPPVTFDLSAGESRQLNVTLAQQLAQLAESGARAQQGPIDPYEGIPPDTHLLALDKRALDEAYHLRIVRLFDVWLTSTQGQDPTAFINGLRIARRGYTLAAMGIARREQEIERTLPPPPQEPK